MLKSREFSFFLNHDFPAEGVVVGVCVWVWRLKPVLRPMGKPYYYVCYVVLVKKESLPTEKVKI